MFCKTPSFIIIILLKISASIHINPILRNTV